MGVFKNIFTWWEGATFGTWLGTRFGGDRVGSDALGNVYYTGGKRADGQKRRWVVYAGANDASRIAPEWHSWLHGQSDLTPDELPPPRPWLREAEPNLTGTPLAYRPQGAPEPGRTRATAAGDYTPWSPDAT